ncbi:hypothetical protein F0L68_11615 [Solihabitans fulvus]|uniref:Uncharacterized protein n=1 Tax=Solihabitans fulvus TaxID=1892852 RepID=A0A5B2XI02_9PSEU|nr:hypothetical protein [Solihabitans fulvus]KAA2262551.1 hypothetical protein F0L68_11615 [Solihabitans fulvus]
MSRSWWCLVDRVVSEWGDALRVSLLLLVVFGGLVAVLETVVGLGALAVWPGLGVLGCRLLGSRSRRSAV